MDALSATTRPPPHKKQKLRVRCVVCFFRLLRFHVAKWSRLLFSSQAVFNSTCRYAMNEVNRRSGSSWLPRLLNKPSQTKTTPATHSFQAPPCGHVPWARVYPFLLSCRMSRFRLKATRGTSFRFDARSSLLFRRVC